MTGPETLYSDVDSIYTTEPTAADVDAARRYIARLATDEGERTLVEQMLGVA